MVLEFHILGPFEVVDHQKPVALGSQRQRALLAMLLLGRGEVLSRDRLVDQLWGQRPPASSVKILQGYVSHLRRTLGRELLVTRGSGYQLMVKPDQVDAERFDALAFEGRQALAGGDAAGARDGLSSALELWRGDPLADFAYELFAQSEITRLQEARLAALEDRIDADLALGDHRRLVGELESLTITQPTRERLTGQLMLALYRCGRQVDALEVYQRVRAALSEQLGLEPGRTLTALQAQILRQSTLLEGESASVVHEPVRIDGARVPPRPATATIGRQHDTEAVSRLLESTATRLVTLTGPGGVGKTRLALAVASAIESRLADGACWVELAGVVRAEDVGSAVARALALTTSQAEIPLELLRRYLAPRELLLVIDNFEHVLTSAVLVSDLIAASPRLKVLVTSREALHLSAEHRFEVRPLAVPVRPESATAAEIEATGATALFVAAARRRDSRFAATEASASALARICVRLGGLPLALELAAARTGLWGVQELADRIDTSIESLGEGPRDAPARQRTLSATIDWSYRLLANEEGQTFDRFAVFAGGATIDAAQAITGATGKTIEALIDKSMLVTHPLASGAKRLVMLEPVRQNTLARLAPDPGQDEIRRRHYEYYLDLVIGTAPRLHTEDQRDAVAILDREVDNLRAALHWALEAAPAQALRLAGRLGDYWIAREDLHEVSRLQAALDAAGDGAPSEDRARALLQVSQMWSLDQEEETFVKAARAALALYTEAQDHAGIAGALLSLASLVSSFEDDLALDRRYTQEAYRHARMSGDERIIGSTLARLGYFSIEDRASLLEQAHEILVRTGDLQEIAGAYSRAAWAALVEDRAAEASEHLEIALRATDRVISPRLLAEIWGSTGLARLFSGRLTEGREAFEEALSLCVDHAFLDLTSEALVGLGAVAAAESRHEAAARLRGAARSMGHPQNKSAIPIEDRLERDYFAPAQDRYGSQAWSRAEAHGKAMSEEQAIKCATAESNDQHKPDQGVATPGGSFIRLVDRS